MSKSATVLELQKKICRALSTYLYNVLKNKSVMVAKIRLWRSNYDKPDDMRELDTKYGNYTHVKIDAQILNINVRPMQSLLGRARVSIVCLVDWP